MSGIPPQGPGGLGALGAIPWNAAALAASCKNQNEKLGSSLCYDAFPPTEFVKPKVEI